MINRIYQIEELSDLESYLMAFDNQDELRENLFNEFLIYADYKNAGDWNKAVRMFGNCWLGRKRTITSH